MSTVFKLSFSSNNVQAVRNFKKFKTEESRVIQILFQGKEHTIHFRTNFKYKFARCYFFLSLRKLQNASNVLIKHVRFDKALLTKRMRIRFSLLKKINLVYREFWLNHLKFYFKQISSRNWCNECLNKWFLELIPFKLLPFKFWNTGDWKNPLMKSR